MIENLNILPSVEMGEFKFDTYCFLSYWGLFDL